MLKIRELHPFEVNWIYYCTFFMDGIKIIPRNENCELGGSSGVGGGGGNFPTKADRVCRGEGYIFEYRFPYKRV